MGWGPIVREMTIRDEHDGMPMDFKLEHSITKMIPKVKFEKYKTKFKALNY